MEIKKLLELPSNTKLARKSTMNRTDTGTVFYTVEEACKDYLRICNGYENVEDGKKFLADLVIAE